MENVSFFGLLQSFYDRSSLCKQINAKTEVKLLFTITSMLGFKWNPCYRTDYLWEHWDLQCFVITFASHLQYILWGHSQDLSWWGIISWLLVAVLPNLTSALSGKSPLLTCFFSLFQWSILHGLNYTIFHEQFLIIYFGIFQGNKLSSTFWKSTLFRVHIKINSEI